MAGPIAKGVIITVSLVVAAGIAAYESPHVRQWLDRSREKIAVALHSLGDDIHPRSSTTNPDDVSMREDQSEKAEERRRQIRQEIMEKGRVMEDRMKRRQQSSPSNEAKEKRSPSFDTLVDAQGNLRPQPSSPQANAQTSAVEVLDPTGSLRSRHAEQLPRYTDEPGTVRSSTETPGARELSGSPHVQQIPEYLHQSVDAPMLLRQFSESQARENEAWESQYEREMRNTWNISLPEPSAAPASHASESLIDLTPTTEDFPDPEHSVPSVSDFRHPLARTEYFSMPGSRSSHTMPDAGDPNFYYAHPDQPLTPLEPRPMSQNDTNVVPGSSAASVAGSTTYVVPSDLDSEDDFSELGDGIRTPASMWTDVGSNVSGDE